MKLKFTFIVAVALLLCKTNYAEEVTLTLSSCNEDARVDDYTPNTNYGNEIEYFSGAWTISNVPTIWRNFFKFDLSCIPANATIQTASLSLFWADVNGWGNMQHSSLTNSNESVLQRVTSPWAESVVTWNNQPSVTVTDQVILPQSTSGTQDYTNINVAAMVQQMIGTNNNGFSLRLTNEAIYAALIFASSDNSNTAKHPTLTITYTTPLFACVSYKLTSCFDEDARVDDYQPLTNFSSEVEYFSGAWTISNTPTVWRNLFRFNRLSCIPSNAVIQSASLSLFWANTNSWGNMQHSSLSNTNESVLQRVTLPWSETAVTWYNQPLTTTTDEVILPQSTSGTQDYLNINVTGMVQQMVSTNNYGFLLKLTNEFIYAALIFASADHPDASKHPVLDVCYSMPSGVNEVAQSNNISIYPNPITSSSILQLSEPVKNAEMVMYDMLGKEILKKNFSGNKTEIEKGNLAGGIYFVRVNAEEKQFVQRIIVE